MTRTTHGGHSLVVLLLLLVPSLAAAFDLPVFYADWSNDRIVAIDPVTGDRSTISSAAVGSGPAFSSLAGVAIEPVAGVLYATDVDLDAVIAVNVLDGERTIVSSNTVGSGPALGNPGALLVHGADHTLLVADEGIRGGGGATNPPYLLRVDPDTGDREIVSGDGVGGGPELSTFAGMVAERGASVLIGDSGLEAVLRIDLATGDRTVISQAGVVGTGIAIDDLSGLAASSATDLFAIDRLASAVIHVDVLSGHRALLSDATHGIGPELANPLAVAYDAPRQRLLVAYADLLAVDPETGDRSIVSGGGVGTGPSLGVTFAIATVPEPAAGLLTITSAAALAFVRRAGRR